MHFEPPEGGGATEYSPELREANISLRDVSMMLGVPAPTIRSWERRHGLPTVLRNEHGHRRYRPDEVALLRRMRDQRVLGTNGSEALAAAAPPLVWCQLLLSAVGRLDAEQVGVVLDLSLATHGLPVTLDDVLLPSMREVGRRWSRGNCDVAEEDLATAAVLAWLSRRADSALPSLDEAPIVLSSGPLDRHTVSLEAFCLLLREQQFDCRNLGAQTSAAALRQAVEQCSAQAVVLVCQLGQNRAAAVTALEAVGGTDAAVFYAGAAFRTKASRPTLLGHYLGGNFSNAAAYITTCLRR